MASSKNEFRPDSVDEGTRWEGYANYQSVSFRVAESVDQAIDAYSQIESAHTEGARINPEFAAEARSQILSAAVRLYPELEQDRESVDLYDQILGRWEGQDGYLEKFSETSLRRSFPGWLVHFVIDIRSAAWELGYLQAGRRAKSEPEDPVEGMSSAMFTE